MPGNPTAASRCAIVRAFSRVAARRPSDPVLLSSGRHATFADVEGLSVALAARLPEPHPRGAVAGLAAVNGPGFLAGFLALRRTGYAVLLLDPRAPREEQRRIVAALGASAVLECPHAWPDAPDAFRVERADDAPLVLPGDAAALKLTSGSTGAPRGVAMSAEALLADEDALARTMGLRDDDRLWGALPFSHSYGFTTLALSALVRGLALVIPADAEPFASLATARALAVTVFPTVPAYIQALLKLPNAPSWPGSVRLVISAGAVLPPATAAQFRERYGQPVHTFYGASECGGICYDRAGDAAERGTVGTPVEGVTVSLRPDESVAAHEGLVVVESGAVGAAYVPGHDTRLGGGRFETNDVGVWQRGELALRRRSDRAINVRGRKVDPSEVEHVLAAFHGVEEAVVMGVATPDGRGEMVHAVIACSSVPPGQQDITDWCRHRLADHKVPRSVVFVAAIPRTARGKIDRSALAALSTAGLVHGDAHER